ncbi:MAG TPA: hypothetical protein VK628_04895 [Flavitalea sp.]|nr:hypothetical protein [Flavitalea sp.]
MKLLFLAIGKTNEGYLDPGIEDYTKRVSNYFPVTWKVIPPVKGGSLSVSALKKRKRPLPAGVKYIYFIRLP